MRVRAYALSRRPGVQFFAWAVHRVEFSVRTDKAAGDLVLTLVRKQLVFVTAQRAVAEKVQNALNAEAQTNLDD